VLADVIPSIHPWSFHPHPEVWLLVSFLIGAYVYVVKVIGPRAVPAGTPAVTRKQVWCFVGAMTLLWAASDWPIHDIGEEYLYSVHMLQHMMLSYFLPPLALLATPEWFARELVGTGRAYRVLKWFCFPVASGLIFNVVVMVTHIPVVVNRSAVDAPLHYSLHFLLVTTALLMWMPVCGPFKELQMGHPAKMVYLFLMSVVPTVPAGWLTFADNPVYRHYDIPVRVFGLSVISDQQLAGGIMKLGGSVFLWTVITFMWFARFETNFDEENSYKRRQRIPDAEIAGHDDAELTFDEVTAAFDRSTPAPEPEHRV
jgi:putative membrane protein